MNKKWQWFFGFLFAVFVALSFDQSVFAHSASGIVYHTDWDGCSKSYNGTTEYDISDISTWANGTIMDTTQTGTDYGSTSYTSPTPCGGAYQPSCTSHTHQTSSPTTGTCSASWTYTSPGSGSQADKNDGVVTIQATWNGADGETDGNTNDVSSTINIYYVTDVDIWYGNNGTGNVSDLADNVNGEFIYEYEEPPDVFCQKTYSQSSNKTEDCEWDYSSSDLTEEIEEHDFQSNGSRTFAQQCYRYDDPYVTTDASTDNVCARSYYVDDVTLRTTTNDTNYSGFTYDVYTGIPQQFFCRSDFYVNPQDTSNVLDVSNTHYPDGSVDIWNTDKTTGAGFTDEDQMGQDRYIYTDRRGRDYDNTTSSPVSLNYNMFYAADPNTGNYNVRCTYYPEAKYGYDFPRTTNSIHSQSSWDNRHWQEETTTLQGIREIRTKVDGCFYEYSTTFSASELGQYRCLNDQYPSLDDYTATAADTTGWLPDANTDAFGQFDFITGHWYAFQTELLYDDNTDGYGNTNTWRDITGTEEIYYDHDQWYQNEVSVENWFTNFAIDSTCSSCSSSTDFNGLGGQDHRIPQSEWNFITTHYFNNNGTNWEHRDRTHKEVLYWAHGIEKIKIRGDGTSYNTLAVDGMDTSDIHNSLNTDPPYAPSDNDTNESEMINPGDTKRYTAWVIWTDDPENTTWSDNPDYAFDETYNTPNPFSRGQREDWTNDLLWTSDDLVDANPSNVGARADIFFERRSNSEYRTVRVEYTDFGDNYTIGPTSAGMTYWDYDYDELLVKVTDTCDNGYIISINCEVPNDTNQNWQTIGFGVASNCTVVGSPYCDYNYLPPSNVYGFPSWNGDYNPYRYSLKFKVTGISNGSSDE